LSFGINVWASLGLGYYSSNVSVPTAVTALSNVNMERVWAGGRMSFMSSQVTNCPGNCYGHGQCNNMNGDCKCNAPWTFELDCLTAYCPNDCSGHGTCNRLTGLCSCVQPYLPLDCSTASCPFNCTSSFNGVCDTSKGVCACKANASVAYIGFDCFTPDPLHVFDPLEYGASPSRSDFL
jgi:hypothetical protein